MEWIFDSGQVGPGDDQLDEQGNDQSPGKTNEVRQCEGRSLEDNDLPRHWLDQQGRAGDGDQVGAIDFLYLEGIAFPDAAIDLDRQFVVRASIFIGLGKTARLFAGEGLRSKFLEWLMDCTSEVIAGEQLRSDQRQAFYSRRAG